MMAVSAKPAAACGWWRSQSAVIVSSIPGWFSTPAGVAFARVSSGTILMFSTGTGWEGRRLTSTAVGIFDNACRRAFAPGLDRFNVPVHQSGRPGQTWRACQPPSSLMSSPHDAAPTRLAPERFQQVTPA